MPRPLFKKSIVELEELFDEWQGSPNQLMILKAELDHRTRPKAVHLRNKVEAILVGEVIPAVVRPPATQTEFWPDTTDEPNTRETRRTTPRAPRVVTHASTDNQEYLAPPAEFTQVQPKGVAGRPSAYHPTLKEDCRLDVSRDDPQAKVFRVAIAELIREMKKNLSGRNRFSLEHGFRVQTDANGSSYQFEFNEDANLFEGAKVEIIIGSRLAAGQLTALLQGQIIVTLQEDFGDHIVSATLRIDNTALLQALHDRLGVIERGEAEGFGARLALSVLTNAGSEAPPTPLARWPWSRTPTAKQKLFVETALANELTWLWGPPGTGKTDSLSALSRLLYESGKRVLICSNTNRAVDQLLQKLCSRMQETKDPALEAGHVLRLGRIEDELEKEFGEYIAPDRIVERKSQELLRRQDAINAELERLEREVTYSRNVLARFDRLDTAKEASTTAGSRVEAVRRELDKYQSAITAAERSALGLTEEMERRQHAGAFRRFFMRGEEEIRRDTRTQQSRIQASQVSLDATKDALNVAECSSRECAQKAGALGQELVDEDRRQHQRILDECNAKQGTLREELGTIEAKIEDIRNTVLQEAHIVGATVTRTFLRPAEFTSFDAVVMDEASMVLLPAVFQAAGLATEKVVIAGDFRQLPPIIQTNQRCIHDVLALDVFEKAGIRIDTVGNTPRLVTLDEQFRMTDSICRIVSTAFYDGALRTHPDCKTVPLNEPDPLSDRLTIIDTSRVWPFTTRNAFGSRLNLMHALVIRNLVLHLREQDRLFDQSGKCRVGVCAPYAAQASLLRDVFRAHSLDPATLRASTVHGFQGDERPLMILDLVDSVGERHAGIFLQANQLNDSGAKLMNVALSRAQQGLVIVANLTFLDKKLPGDAILRGLLNEIQDLGTVLDVRDVLGLYPILEDLKCFGSQPDLNPESLRTGLFGERDFAKLCLLDMANAKQAIVVFSGFITPQRVAQLGDVFRRKIEEGVKIRCVTRPPNRNGTMPEELGREALATLESLGVAVDLRNNIHEKAVLIDTSVAWFGSLNPLSHTSLTTELMARFNNEGVAFQFASFLSITRRPAEDFAQGAGADSENPPCGTCGGRSVLMRGKKYGPFFRCANGDNWTQSVDRATRNSNRRRSS